MKTKHHYIVALLLCALTLLNVIPTYALASETASDYRTVHNEHLLKVEKLPEIVEQVFALNDIEAGEPAFIVDDFFDPSRIKKRLTMSIYFSSMLDLGVDLEFLLPYGVTKISDGKYSIDNTKTPQWSIASDIFYYISSPDNFKRAKRSLREMGLSSDELNKIEQYIHENNIDIANTKLIFQYLKPVEKQLKTTKSASTKAALAFDFTYNFRIQKELNWYKWIQELLSQFPAMKQQALINYGTKNLGLSHFIATPETESKNISFANRIDSGEYRNQLHERIKVIQSLVNNKGDK